jgi:hypothetical protein
VAKSNIGPALRLNACPTRFRRMLPFLAASLILLALSLVGIPQEGAALGAPIGIGGAWLSLVLAIPSHPGVLGCSVLCHDVSPNFGNSSTRWEMRRRERISRLSARRSRVGFARFEMAAAVARIRAAVDALNLREQLAQGYLPLVIGIEGVGPGDRCRYASPARCGHRRADEIGDLLLTESRPAVPRHR